MAAPYVDADARTLRGLAHPIRQKLMYELYARGTSTATTLAEALSEPVNSVSFHLRQLARYDLIEEAPAQGKDGRQRWWRPAASEGIHISTKIEEESAEGRAAFALFRRHSVATWHALIDRFFGPHDDTVEVWANNDVPMLLTDDEAHQCAEELYSVMRKWHEHGQRRQPPGDPEPRTYLAVSMILPHRAE